MICEYGCGRKAKHQFKNGKSCCSENWHTCPNRIKRGSQHPCYGKKRPDLSLRNKINPPSKGRIVTERQKKRMVKTRRKNGSYKVREETKEKIRKSLLGRKVSWSKERLANFRIKMCGLNNHSKRLDVRKKLSESGKKYYANLPSKYKRDFQRKPNIPEKEIDNLTPNIIRYTGDKSYWVQCEDKTRNPDFKVRGQKKLIELFGEYWHKPEEERVYIDEYEKVGYDCLIVWYRDWISNKDRELNRILEFTTLEKQEKSSII